MLALPPISKFDICCSYLYKSLDCPTFVIMHPKGPVWNHFKESGDSVVCNHCNKNYNKATAKSSTNPLRYNLKVKHSIHPDKSAARSSATSPKKPATSRLITSFVQRKSQQKMYAELAATDRLWFNQIARSDFIRSAMREKKFIAHSSPTTIRSKVFEFYQEAKAAVTDELKLGRIAPCEHIVCLSHALHLVITEVFYKKKKTADDSDLEEMEDQEQQDDDDEEEVDDNDASIPSLEEPLGLG